MENGDIADYRTTTQGMELEVMDAEESVWLCCISAGMRLRLCCADVCPSAGWLWTRTAPTVCRIPAFHSETVAVYPGDKNHLPYDVVVERLHIEEPEPPAPVTEPEKNLRKCWMNIRFPFRSTANGRPSPMQSAEEASYEEYKDNLRRNAQNFRITDEHLG
ncbi:hypothetical protein HLY09_00010 [Enterocloster bolteae]|nr:hypothetical protein HLY09_00010 [Enterocloster bolteae]